MSRLAAEWLSLGASPTFATMAVATTLADAGPLDMLCAPAVQGSWPLDPMATMYLLMSAFHVSPWLKRFGRTQAPRDV